MKLNKVEPKFISNANPRIGLITLGSDFRIEKDFNNIIYGRDIDLYVNRIHCYNPLTNETLAKMADDIQQRQWRHLPYRPSVIASRDETSKLWQFLQDQDDFEFKTIEDILNELDSCTAQNECLSETLNTTLATI